MKSILPKIKSGIVSEYKMLKGADESEVLLSFAGHGATEAFTCFGPKKTSVLWETNKLILNIRNGRLEGCYPDDQEFERGRMEITGNVIPRAVYKDDVYIITRDSFLKSVANCYNHKAEVKETGRKKEYWTNMVLHLLKQGLFTPSEGHLLTDKSPSTQALHSENYQLEEAILSTKELREVWELTNDHGYIAVLSGTTPFKLARPEKIIIEGEYGLEYDGMDCDGPRGYCKIDQTDGKLSLNLAFPSFFESVFRLPCAVRSGPFSIPNVKNDIARTDGIRKKTGLVFNKDATKLTGSRMELYIEGASRARQSYKYRDFIDDFKYHRVSYPLATLVCAAAGAAIGVGLPLAFSALNEVSSYIRDSDFQFVQCFEEFSKLLAPFTTAFGAGSGIVGGYAWNRNLFSLEYTRMIKGTPSMNYWVRGESV